MLLLLEFCLFVLIIYHRIGNKIPILGLGLYKISKEGEAESGKICNITSILYILQ